MANLKVLTPIDFAQSFAQFICAAPTSYHAAAWEAAELRKAGFIEQDEHEKWIGSTRGFVQRSGAVIAWQLPSKIGPNTGFRIVGSHNDSPSFKIKPNPDTAAFGFSQVNVEIYGGPLLNSWLNRDLGIAGQISTIDGETHLVQTPPIMFIPQLAPHLDRTQNTDLKLSLQVDYHPVWALGEQSVFEYLAASAGVAANRIAGMDLYAYDAEQPRIFGGVSGADFFAAGRQDNLSSVFAALNAFQEAAALTAGAAAEIADSHDEHEANAHEANEYDGDVLIFAAFDHEEVGSSTFTGAEGPLLEHILRRICTSLISRRSSANAQFSSDSAEAFLQMLANSSCISADAAHSINPNKAEKHDPAHHPVLGGGAILKINSQQRYATEAQGIALWLRACESSAAPTQEFVSNNDVPCGSTIGPATAARLGIVTVDVGIPLLSMHSVREISAPADLLGLAKTLKEYYAGA
ncbi:M18 family aminopeptidase [Arcanobacterium hippocoleae]